MLAWIYIHPAGSGWRSGSPIDAESIGLSASAGPDAPSLAFTTSLAQRPRPRRDQATLVIDGHPVESVFTPVQRGATMTGAKDFGGTSNTCVGVIGHLDELVSTGGWTDTSMSAFAASAKAYIATRPGFQSATGITESSFDGLLIDDTIARGTDPNAASIDKFGDELTSLLGAIGRYAVSGGLPLDWRMDTARRLRVATPLRAPSNAPTDYEAGRNCDEITENIDLGIGRVASSAVVGTKDSSIVATIPGGDAFGEIDVLAASGSASAIVTALSSQLRTFGISIGSGRARVNNGVPSLWIGDRVRVRNTDGEWSRCAIISASLAVDEGGTGVSINATAVEGDW